MKNKPVRTWALKDRQTGQIVEVYDLWATRDDYAGNKTETYKLVRVELVEIAQGKRKR